MLDDPMPRAEVLRAVEALMRSFVRERGALIFHAPARSLEMLRFDQDYERDQRTYGTSALCYLFQARGGPSAAHRDSAASEPAKGDASPRSRASRSR